MEKNTPVGAVGSTAILGRQLCVARGVRLIKVPDLSCRFLLEAFSCSQVAVKKDSARVSSPDETSVPLVNRLNALNAWHSAKTS